MFLRYTLCTVLWFSFLFSAPSLSSDFDNDGLTDVDEVNIYGTDPQDDDTDKDTLLDGWEVERFLNPLVANYLLALGDKHSCFRDDDPVPANRVKCWGENVSGQLNSPATLTSASFISAGAAFTCGINNDVDVICWGDDANNQISDAPTGLSNPSFLVSGEKHACVIDDSGLQCWGGKKSKTITIPNSVTNPIWVTAGIELTCVVDNPPAGPEVECWGNNGAGQSTPPTLSNPRSVSAGDNHVCAIDDTGVVCWGNNTHGRATPPSGLTDVTWLDLGRTHSCALNGGEVVCWGRNNRGQTGVPADLVNPTQVVAGDRNTCSLTDFGVVCWGDDRANQSNPDPVNLFIDPDGDGVSSQGGQDAFPLDATYAGDADNDGLPDSYEDANGLDSNDPADALADSELPVGDGIINLDEFANGTDPNAVEYSSKDTVVNIKPRYHRFGHDLIADPTCSSNDEVTYTVTNSGASVVTLGTVFVTPTDSAYDNYFQVKSGDDNCSNQSLAAGGSCTFDLIYCPTQTEVTATALVQIATNDEQTPLASAALTSGEGLSEIAKRRIPGIVSDLSINPVPVNNELTEGVEYTFTFTFSGYHESYQLAAAYFDCTQVAELSDCGLSFAHSFGNSGFVSPSSQTTGSWSDETVSNQDFTYMMTYTVPNVDADQQMVLRLYQRSNEASIAGQFSLSALLPGNLSAQYFDASGRRLVFTIKNVP